MIAPLHLCSSGLWSWSGGDDDVLEPQFLKRKRKIKTTMEELADELLLKIMPLLDPVSCARLSCVSRRFRELQNDHDGIVWYAWTTSPLSLFYKYK